MTAYIHADLMALYAQDAKETDKPWERWQYNDGLNDWTTCTIHPSWIPRHLYRRKVSNGEILFRALNGAPADWKHLDPVSKRSYEEYAQTFLNAIKEQ